MKGDEEEAGGGGEQTETGRSRETLADGRGETRGSGEQHDTGSPSLGLASHGLLEEIEKYHLIEQAPVLVFVTPLHRLQQVG